MDILSPKLDLVFKYLFSDVNNQDLLTDFLSHALDIPLEDIGEVEVRNTELIPEASDGKFSRLDLNLKVKDRVINVEIQRREEPAFRERSLFYWSKLYTGDLKESEGYGNLPSAVAINIIDFKLFDCPGYHSVFELREKNRGERLTDRLQINFLELKKVKKEPDPEDGLQQWMCFLNAESEEDLEMLKKMENPAISKATVVIRHMSEDDKLRYLAEVRENARRDEISALEGARKVGREEERTRMAELMRQQGVPEDIIQKCLDSNL